MTSEKNKKNGNAILNTAKYSLNNTDEWYTTYETIAEEVEHYRNQFKGKVVLCNCDDPYASNFCYYFLKHFNRLKLKKLICTSYIGSKVEQIQQNRQITFDFCDIDRKKEQSEQGYVLIVTKMPGDEEKEISDDVIENVMKR